MQGFDLRALRWTFSFFLSPFFPLRLLSISGFPLELTMGMCFVQEGYERLCCLHCIQTRDTNYGTTCICRVPKDKLAKGTLVECAHCGCRYAFVTLYSLQLWLCCLIIFSPQWLRQWRWRQQGTERRVRQR
jgi:hypothetical protein